MVLFPPPFYFIFDISNLLSYIQNISSNELARPVMGTISQVIIQSIVCFYDAMVFVTVFRKTNWSARKSIYRVHAEICVRALRR